MKIKILLAFLLLSILPSCQKELTEPNSATTTTGGGVGVGTSTTCKDCIYS